MTEIVRYQQDQDGQQELSRQTFNYQNGRLMYYRDERPGRSMSFNFKYVGGKVASVHTPDRNTVLSIEYDEFERIKTASYVVDNREQSVFSLYYASNDRATRLIRLVETRVTLPTNSFVASRIFQFSYGEIASQTEDVVSQMVQNGYKDGSRTEEETVYQQDAGNHSPFYDSGQPIVLALLSLTNHTEADAARYLQRFDCKSFIRRVFAADGAVILQESSQFATDYEESFNPIRSTESSHITIPADSSPADRHYLQTFQYNCIE